MSNQQVGHGSTIAFATSNWQANVNVETMRVGAATRAVVPTNHLGLAAPGTNKQGNATSIPGKIITLGPLVLEVQFDPGATKYPPIKSDPETVTLTWPNGESWSGSGYISEVGEISIESNTLVKCTITVERTGNWTMA